MDMLSSIIFKNYLKEKVFVKDVVDMFLILLIKIDVGVVIYNWDVKLWIKFG